MIALYDTSVWAWAQRDPQLRAELDEAIEGDRVAICTPVALELLYSARNHTEFDHLREDLSALRQCPVGPSEWDRALVVYGLLARQGGAHQRQVKHFDLLIAAAAESAGIPVVHYDEDYDRIAVVTGQPVHWARTHGAF